MLDCVVADFVGKEPFGFLLLLVIFLLLLVIILFVYFYRRLEVDRVAISKLVAQVSLLESRLREKKVDKKVSKKK